MAIVFCLFFLPLTNAQAPRRPLSKNDIIKLLKGDVPQARVAELGQQRGIDFPITPETEAELRKAGPNHPLLITLRAIAPKPTVQAAPAPPVLLINSTPGNAKVWWTTNR